MGASSTAKKIAGTFLDAEKPPPALRWLSEVCRSGSLAKGIHSFIQAQKEPLDIDLLIVDKVTEDRLICRIPTKVADHESTSTFRVDVSFALDPTTGVCSRIEGTP